MRRLRQLSESLKTKDLYIKKGERRAGGRELGGKPTSVPAVAEKNIFYPEKERTVETIHDTFQLVLSLYLFSTSIGAEVYRREKHIHEVLLFGCCL